MRGRETRYLGFLDNRLAAEVEQYTARNFHRSLSEMWRSSNRHGSFSQNETRVTGKRKRLTKLIRFRSEWEDWKKSNIPFGSSWSKIAGNFRALEARRRLQWLEDSGGWRPGVVQNYYATSSAQTRRGGLSHLWIFSFLSGLKYKIQF